MKQIDLSLITSREGDFIDLLNTSIWERTQVYKWLKHITTCAGCDAATLLLRGGISRDTLAQYLKSAPIMPSFQEVEHFMEKLYEKVWPGFEKKYRTILFSHDCNICPYCNIRALWGQDSEFDHFKPKEFFPELYICLSNLIPSCHPCNWPRGKHTKEIPYSPYFYSFHDLCSMKLVEESTWFTPDIIEATGNYAIRFDSINPADNLTQTQIDNLNLVSAYNDSWEKRTEIKKRLLQLTIHKNNPLYQKYILDTLDAWDDVMNYIREFDEGEEEFMSINKIRWSKLNLDIRKQFGI